MKRALKSIEAKEEKIIKLLEHGDEVATSAFRKVVFYYRVNDLKNNRNYCKLINNIYVKKTTAVKWVLANECNIGHSTLFRYRNEIVQTFYSCCDNQELSSEII